MTCESAKINMVLLPIHMVIFKTAYLMRKSWIMRWKKPVLTIDKLKNPIISKMASIIFVVKVYHSAVFDKKK